MYGVVNETGSVSPCALQEVPSACRDGSIEPINMAQSVVRILMPIAAIRRCMALGNISIEHIHYSPLNEHAKHKHASVSDPHMNTSEP